MADNPDAEEPDRVEGDPEDHPTDGADAGTATAAGEKKPRNRRARKHTHAPLFPDRAAEDRPEGWGDSGRSEGAKSDEEYQRDRPPHW